MSMVVAGLVGAGSSVIGGVLGMGSARKQARAAAAERRRLQAELKSLENNRQAIVNPYENVKDVSYMISNPYANLGVATQAAEMQAEQADISLANTLDALKETGAGAGGATALAQAALQSKKEISANIEQQEAANEKLRAQGESEMQRIKMSEAQRVQEAEAAGKQFMFGAREAREQGKIDRVAAQLSGAQAREMQAQADYTGALTGMIGGITSAVGSFAQARAARNAGSNPNG